MKLCEENYFSEEAQKFYTGSSQIKDFLKCSAKAKAQLNGEWKEEPSTSQLVGSYVDAAMSETLDVFKAKHPEILKKDGSLKSEYLHAEYILSRIERDKMFKKYISGDHQTIMTAIFDFAEKNWYKEEEYFAIYSNLHKNVIPVKVKLDSYFPNKAIVDLKVVKDFDTIYNEQTKQRENFIDYWGYTMQAALYQKVVEVNTGKKLPFFIAAVTKEKEPDIALLNIDQETMDYELSLLEEWKLGLVANYKMGNGEVKRCEHCDYCHFTKEITQIINYKDLGKEE